MSVNYVTELPRVKTLSWGCYPSLPRPAVAMATSTCIPGRH